MTDRFDLVTIGGGTAGLVASLGVAGIGGKAALIEAALVGGDCLWTGCVPSKALLAAGSVAQTMRTADRHGIAAVEPQVDLARVMASVRRAQEIIEPQDSPERLRSHGVEVIEGRGRFVGPGRIEVDGRVVSYRAALIATGARPVVPPIDGLADADPLTSDTVWDLEVLPPRLAVLGGGPIGCELGQAFARLGSSVTIVEAQPTLVPIEHTDVGTFLAERLSAEGIDVRTGVRAQSVTGEGAGWLLHLDDGTDVGFDRILVAVGRRPNTTDLGLESVGVETDDRGYVVIDDRLVTTGDRIYAAGDVTGKMPFTHVAANHARLVVTNAMLRTRRSVDYDRIPWVTFTDPEIARVGLDAAAAQARWGDNAVVQRYDYTHLDRAVTEATNRGWAELVGDPKRRLVGATVVGEAAGESIAELTAWIAAGAKIDAVSTTVHAYPTFSEGPSRAADDVLRARYFDPRLTRLTSKLLGALRGIDKPRTT
jgi:pyruvate/2-oxoglutarate dehydrogenase complex dihydrolipoamide dehydrogenase (E3) component